MVKLSNGSRNGSLSHTALYFGINTPFADRLARGSILINLGDCKGLQGTARELQGNWKGTGSELERKQEPMPGD